MAETVLRWVTRVQPARLPELRAALARIRTDLGKNTPLPLACLPMLHFASLTLFDEGEDEKNPLLVFESNIDRPFRDYVNQLVCLGREGLDAIYSCCDGYPGRGATNAEFGKYLSGLKRRAQLYHIGHPNRSVQEIRGDYELKRSIAHELETNALLKDRSPAEIVRDIRRMAHCPSPFWPLLRPWHDDWATAPSKPPQPPTPLNEIKWVRDHWPWGWLGRSLLLVGIAWLNGIALVLVLSHYLSVPHGVTILLGSLGVFSVVRQSSPDVRIIRGVFAAAVVGLLVDLPFRYWPLFSAPPSWLPLVALLVLLPGAFVLVSYVNILLRLAVTRPFPELDKPLRARVRTLLAAEDRDEHSIYNHVAGLSALKDRFRLIRCVRTWLTLHLLNLIYRTQFVKGKLVTIPSIHFAQWSLVRNRYLLFVTNYDGGADSYLDDFFNALAKGVAFIWHDTKIFPGTTDPRRLKVWVRQGQTLASVRYRAAVYDGLTVGAINSNTYIRKRLLRGRGQASGRRWLRRFATIPEEPSVLSRLIGWLRGSQA